MSDLPTLLRDIAAETEARARRDLAGYPERMKPHLEEAAELRAGAARVEALERVAAVARRWDRLDAEDTELEDALRALDALEGE